MHWENSSSLQLRNEIFDLVFSGRGTMEGMQMSQADEDRATRGRSLLRAITRPVSGRAQREAYGPRCSIALAGGSVLAGSAYCATIRK